MSNCYDFTAIQNYTIGRGAIRELRRLTFGMGNKYLILVEKRHLSERIKKDIIDSFNKPFDELVVLGENKVGRAAGLLNTLPKQNPNSVKTEFEFFDTPGKVCSIENAMPLANKIEEYKPDIIVAVGGSKCMDLARTAAHFSGYARPKIVLCPTIIASNASANGMSVIYNKEGTEMVDFWNLAFMPELVIVDTDIVIETPPEIFAAAIGDQISSSIEALHTLKEIGEYEICDRFCIAHHETVIDIMKKYARKAFESVVKKQITPEFEWVCHAVTRYTGPEIAVATAFLSHVLDEALIAFPNVANKPHGQVVGYGVLPEMAAFGTPEEIYEWVDLYREIGIPVNLEELGISYANYDDILEACREANDKVMASRSLIKWAPEDMAAAVMEAERLVNDYINN